MRLLLVSLMLAGAAWGQTPQHRLFEQPNLPHSSLAYFEAFRGAEASCACSAVTGAKGEALTYSRASAQTCTKTVGVEPQQILAGDLVSCPANAPVVMPGPDGTAVSGLLVEAAGTNGVIRSQALADVAWTTANTGAAAPVVTATDGSAFYVDPYGTSLETRIQADVTTAAQLSGIYQQATLAAGSATCSAYVRGATGAGTGDICLQGASYVCSSCAFVSGSSTRCKVSGTGVLNPRVYVGNLSSLNGGTPRTASDMMVLGVQCEVGAVASSYIPTAGAPANRVATGAYFTNPINIDRRQMSLAATVTSPYLDTLAPLGGELVGVGDTGTSQGPNITSLLYGAVSRLPALYVDGNYRATGVPLASTSVARRWWGSTDGTAGTASASLNYAGTLTTGTSIASDAGVSANYVQLGALGGGAASFQINGVVKQICVDTSPTRCR